MTTSLFHFLPVSPSTPIMRGADGPQISISITATLNQHQQLVITRININFKVRSYIFGEILSKHSGYHTG